MQIVSNPSVEMLAFSVSKIVGYELITSDIAVYSHSEVEVSIKGLKAKECILIVGLSVDSNRTIMELWQHLYLLKDMGVSKIYLCLPYFIYARQYTHTRGPKAALKALIDMLNQCNLNGVQLIDIHAEGIKSHVNNSVEIRHYDLFCEHIPNEGVIVAPDQGGGRRVNDYKNKGYKSATLNKTRGMDGEVSINGDREEFYRKDCIIIDDIVDSANTICRAAEFLKESGAKRIEAYVSHNALSRESVRRIEASHIDSLVISDTNAVEPFVLKCKKIKIVSSAGEIARNLQAII
jgi:ribose-phosphate pyrophosphokinase